MQKHRKHVKRWPKLAALAAAGASLVGWMIAAPASAYEPSPEPVCGVNHCTWQFDVAADAYLWQAPPGTAEVWIDVQGANNGTQDPLRWKGQLGSTDLVLQIEHLTNGLISMRGYMNFLGEFVYAAPSGWNQSWVDPSAFGRLDHLPAVADPDGFATITAVMAPRVVGFDLQTGSGQVSALGSINFSEPVTGLDASDFAIWAPPTGCRFENISAVTASNYTFEINGCQTSQVSVNLAPNSVRGMLPGPLEWTFGPTATMNVVAVAPVVQVAPTVAPTVAPSPTPTTAPTPTQTPTTAPTPSETQTSVPSTPESQIPAPVIPQSPSPSSEVAVAAEPVATEQPEVAVPVVAEIPAAEPELAGPETAQQIEVTAARAEVEQPDAELAQVLPATVVQPDLVQQEMAQSATQTPEPGTPALTNFALTATAVAAASAAAVGVGLRARRILQRRQVLRFS